MIEIVTEILEKMEGITGAKKKFITIMFATIFVIRGKQTYRNLSRYNGLSEKTYRRNASQGFNFVRMNQEIIKQSSGENRKIIAIDTTFIKKSGKQTYGLDKFFNAIKGKSEKGLELTTLAIVDLEQNTAYAFSTCQTPAGLATKEGSISKVDKTDKTDKADKMDKTETRMDFYCKYLREMRKLLPEEIKYIAADGYYAKDKFLKEVKEQNLHLVSKLRSDANLQYCFTGEQKSRGAKRKYAGKVKFEDLSKLEFVKEVDKDVKLYTGLVYWMINSQLIRIAVLVNLANPNKIGYCILFCSDINLEPLDIVLFYRSRFQIEFLFRDAKQFTGLSDCQARCKEKLDFHFNSSFTAVNLAKAHLLSLSPSKPFVFSLDDLKRSCFNSFFLELFILNLDLDFDLIKIHPNFSKLCDFGLIAA